jgi:hypothetical protein
MAAETRANEYASRQPCKMRPEWTEAQHVPPASLDLWYHYKQFRQQEHAMLKTGFAVPAVTALGTVLLVAPADAQSQSNRGYYGDSYRSGGQYGRVPQYATGEKRGRPDPTSYDGRRTGYPRTCGHDFFIYSGRTTAGPYCN